MNELLKRLADDQKGATALEYGLLAGFTCLFLIGVFAAVNDIIVIKYENLRDLFAR